MNLKNTYFGYTDNMKVMKAGKVEKTLDKLIRYNDDIMTEKEFAYKALQEGYRPKIIENYSYYSRRLDDYTKPRTLYSLENNDGIFIEVTKTLHDYAKYLLENDFLNEEKAASYIQHEQQRKEEHERLQREQEEKERQERELQRQQQEEKRKQYLVIKMQQWNKKGQELLSQFENNPITAVLDCYWSEIETIYKKHDIQFNKEKEYNNALNKYTIMLGNQDYCVFWIKYYVERENNDPMKLEYNVTKFLEKEILFKVFNIQVTDQPRTITAKVKAVFDNREYKGSNKIKYETFYILNTERQFEPRQGEKMNIEGITCFIHKDDNGNYRITEAKTGMNLGAISPTKKAAIEKAREGIKHNKDKMNVLIERAINNYGLSPLYRETVTA